MVSSRTVHPWESNRSVRLGNVGETDVVKWIVGTGLDMDAPKTTRSQRQVMP